MKTLTEQRLQVIAESVLKEDQVDDAILQFIQGSGARAHTADEIQEISAVFDANLERLSVFNNRVWRGIKLTDWSDMEPEFDFRYKEIVTDPHWMSTSTQRYTAETYMREPVTTTASRNPNVFILFEIMINEETRGLDLRSHGEPSFREYEATAPDDLDWNDQQAVTDYFDGIGDKVIDDEDAEIILQRGSRFRVIAKEQKPCAWKPDAEYWEVKLEWIGAG